MGRYDGWRDYRPVATSTPPKPPQGGTGAVQPRNKFNARKVTVDGQRFDSAKEARRWQELRLLCQAGQIANLQRQRPFPLTVTRKVDGQPELVAAYVADFVYEADGQLVVEDVKSPPTRKLPIYRLKRKLFEALTGLTIQER